MGAISPGLEEQVYSQGKGGLTWDLRMLKKFGSLKGHVLLVQGNVCVAFEFLLESLSPLCLLPRFLRYILFSNRLGYLHFKKKLLKNKKF